MLHATQGSGTTGRWWLAGLSSPDAMAHAFAKAHGRIAADLMTRHVVTVRHDATLAEVAEALTVHGVKRLPVMRNGTLVCRIMRARASISIVENNSRRSRGTYGPMRWKATEQGTHRGLNAPTQGLERYRISAV